MKKKIVIVMLTLIMMFCLVPMSAFAADKTVIRVADKTEFEEAIAQINKDPGDYTIELTNDIQISGAAIKSPCKAAILGNGHTLKLDRYGYISVNKGAELTALLKMLGWRILQGFQSLFHFLKKRCFHRLLREYPTDSLL